jgi:hypothetical protein
MCIYIRAPFDLSMSFYGTFEHNFHARSQTQQCNVFGLCILVARFDTLQVMHRGWWVGWVGGWGVLVIYIYIYIYLIWLVWVALATLAHSYAGIVSFARRLNHGFQERGCICSFLHSWSFALTFVPRNRSLRALSALGSRNRSLRACVCTNTKYAKRLHDISSTFSCSVTETFNTDGASQ